MDIDDIYIRTGEFGYFQWKAFAGSLIGAIYGGTDMVQNIFSGSIPDNMTCIDKNFSACDSRCPSIVYPYDKFQSFSTEWNLTCGTDTSFSSNTQSIFMMGVMIGSFMVGGLGDKYGRFPVILSCQFFSGLFCLISAFAHTWTIYVCFRFLTGFFLSGIINVSFVLTSELVGPSKRGIIGTMPALAFAVGIVILSFVSWLTQNWRVMTAIFGIFGVLCTAPLYCLFEESPRWHLGNGNVEKSKSILKKIARTNGHDLGDIELKVATKLEGSSKGGKLSLISLISHDILRKITLIQLVSWFTCSSVYYGLTIASGDMGGNRYISVILSALVEIPSNLVILYVMNLPQCGRVKSCVGGLIISSLFCGSIWFIPDGHIAVITGLACAGKFFVVTSFAVIFVQAAELYPTPIRNLGLGVISVASRLGGVMAPQIVNLNNIYHNAHFVVFGVLGCLAGVLCLMLPETLGRPLPESPEEIYPNSKRSEKEISGKRKGDRNPLITEIEDNSNDF